MLSLSFLQLLHLCAGDHANTRTAESRGAGEAKGWDLCRSVLHHWPMALDHCGRHDSVQKLEGARGRYPTLPAWAK